MLEEAMNSVKKAEQDADAILEAAVSALIFIVCPSFPITNM